MKKLQKIILLRTKSELYLIMLKLKKQELCRIGNIYTLAVSVIIKQIPSCLVTAPTAFTGLLLLTLISKC